MNKYAENDKSVVGINSQLEVGRYPCWLNGGNVSANDLRIRILIGKITAHRLVYNSCSEAAVGNFSHSPYSCWKKKKKKSASGDKERRQ